VEERRIFCNYISVGVDAQVELKFNEARWENPNRFNSRVGNIAWHAAYGAKLSLRDGKVRRLDTYVESLYVNDQPVAVPENLQALMIMNIPSYAAGATPWGIPKEESVRSRFQFVVSLNDLVQAVSRSYILYEQSC